MHATVRMFFLYCRKSRELKSQQRHSRSHLCCLLSVCLPAATIHTHTQQVLREQLGPGELDAAARVCRTWAEQLAQDVVHCEMCLPGCYELLLCQLEQLAKRFKMVHSWHLWLPAGAQWSLINDLLWLLSR